MESITSLALNAVSIFQEGPAETSSYFIAGYAVIFGTMAIYLASLFIRRRNLHQDLEALEQISESGQ